jgi:hypothetical protein
MPKFRATSVKGVSLLRVTAILGTLPHSVTIIFSTIENQQIGLNFYGLNI